MTYSVELDTILLDVGQDLLQDQCEIVRCTPGAIAVAQDVNAQVAIFGNQWRVSAEVLDQIPSLLVISRPGIGVDNVDLEAATSRGVAVVNTPDSPTVSTAEATVALLLALVKRHKPAARLLATGGDSNAPHFLDPKKGNFSEQPRLDCGFQATGLQTHLGSDTPKLNGCVYADRLPR